MEISFQGKRALVTGAGKGIGREIVTQLVECGAAVVALSRTQADLDSLKQEHHSVDIVNCDVSDWDKTKEILSSVGNIDLLVNNAAVAICEPLEAIKAADIDVMMNINIKAVINITQVIAQNMIMRGVAGSIVNISSQAPTAALGDHIVYSALKGALDAATRVTALALAPKIIPVYTVKPKIIPTAMSMGG